MSAFIHAPAATSSPRQRVGNYRLVRQLGQGGFATVYLGTHRYLGTQAAIKIVQSGLTEAEVSTFLAEARLAARLVHPSIVRVLEFGLEKEMPFLVMDYAPGGTVRQRYPRGSRLAPQVILAYMEHIVQAVHYLHNRELIHRDIKPENLLLGSNHRLLLSDFGITIAAQQAEGDEQARVGTIAYMAPEHIQGRACLASDQYALGVVVYEWLCGAPPFRGSQAEIMHQHLFVAPPSLCQRVPAIPRAVEETVFRALAKDPWQRFTSMQAFAGALQEAFEDRRVVRIYSLPPACNRPAASQPVRARSTRQQQTGKEISALYAGALLISAALGIVVSGLVVPPSLLQLLFTLGLVVLPLAGALARNNRLVFLLTCSLAIAAAVPGIVFQSFMLFVVVYVSLLLLSMLTAFTAHLHGL